MLHALRTVALTAASLVVATPAVAAGWHAQQVQTAPGAPTPTVSDVYYDQHKLRVDAAGQPSLILDLRSGDMVFIDHDAKQYAQASLDELIKMRDDMASQMRSQLKSMPPEMAASLAEQLDNMEQAAKQGLALQKSERTDKVIGHACDVYTWTSGDGRGEACIARKLPVDLSAFLADVAALAKRLEARGANASATSLSLLQFGEHGFPLRTKSVMTFGRQTAETVSEVQAIEAASVPAAKFAPPAGYTATSFQALTEGAGRRGRRP